MPVPSTTTKRKNTIEFVGCGRGCAVGGAARPMREGPRPRVPIQKKEQHANIEFNMGYYVYIYEEQI